MDLFVPESAAAERVVDELWVDPAHRGNGIASALLDRAEDWGRERGAERATLHVDVDNESARALYVARGYDTRRLSLDTSL